MAVRGTSVFTATLDRRDELKFLERYEPRQVERIMDQAAKEGGNAAAKVLRSNAPTGTAQRLSQYYRRMQLQHGTFRKSVKAAAIRQRGSGILGYVVGPIGSKAFTRHWIELGTRHSRGNPWVQSSASTALSVAQRASDAVLGHYADG